jgi:hypothetical protein
MRFSLRTLVLLVLTLGVLGYLNFVPTPISEPREPEQYYQYGFPFIIVSPTDEPPDTYSGVRTDPSTGKTVGYLVTMNVARERGLPVWVRISFNVLVALTSLFGAVYFSERHRNKKPA